jgi:hypothetical protein
MRFFDRFQPFMILMDLTEDIQNSLLQQSVKCMQEHLSESVKYNDNMGNAAIGGRLHQNGLL